MNITKIPSLVWINEGLLGTLSHSVNPIGLVYIKRKKSLIVPKRCTPALTYFPLYTRTTIIT